MMNYEMFKEVVKEKILSYMPDEFANHTVVVKPVKKINETLDGLHLMSPNMEDRKVVPTIYLNHMYEIYQKGGNLQEELNMAAVEMTRAFGEGEHIKEKLYFDNAEKQVVMTLVNTEQNREMLKDMPHREFQDLSIVYRYVVEIGEQGIVSVPIKNEVAAIIKMDEEKLFYAAAENTKRLFPPQIHNMNELLREILVMEGMPKNMVNAMLADMPENKPMWVITNEHKVFGAASMLYEDKLHKLAEDIGSDLYIMPSSIHEVITVSANMGDPNELAEMVAEVNMDKVPLNERLSNQVYHYDKDLRKLTLATDTPNKKLDGLVTEPQLIYEAKQSR